MSSVLTGIGSYAYFGIEGTRGAGDPSSEKHLPFNSYLQISLGEIGYEQVQEWTPSARTHSIEYTTKKILPDVTITTRFRGYFLLLTLFTHKTVTNPWTGTGDVITGDMTDTDDEDTIWMQLHVDNLDGSNDLNLLYKGGKIVNYKLILEDKKPITEEVTIRFDDCISNTQLVDMDAGLDDQAFDNATSGADGGYDAWDGELSGVILSKDCTVTWNSVALAATNWKKITFEFPSDEVYENSSTSLVPDIFWSGRRDQPTVLIEGTLKGNQALTQLLTVYGSKTKASFKIAWDADKYIQLTNVYYDRESGYGIPESGKSAEGTLTMKGGAACALSFSWTGDEATDPSSYISTS